jgi:16S rRNA (guanine(527)-N(7))-methyltransferase RsmG
MFHVEPQTADPSELATLVSVLEHLSLAEALMSPLLAYASAVERDADRLGLVSESAVEDFLTRHVAESLLFAAVETPQAGTRWTDLGSGAGLPGIPLAIAFPATAFTLIEPQYRRAGFLELLIEDLGLGNVHVIPERAQRVTDLSDVAVTRAFSSHSASGADPGVFELLRGLTVPGGSVLVQVAQNATEPSIDGLSSIEVNVVDLHVRFLRMAGD